MLLSVDVSLQAYWTLKTENVLKMYGCSDKDGHPCLICDVSQESSWIVCMLITVLLHTANKDHVKYGSVCVASYPVWHWVASSSRIEVLWSFCYFFQYNDHCMEVVKLENKGWKKLFQIKVVWWNLQLIVKKIYLI